MTLFNKICPKHFNTVKIINIQNKTSERISHFLYYQSSTNCPFNLLTKTLCIIKCQVMHNTCTKERPL